MYEFVFSKFPSWISPRFVYEPGKFPMCLRDTCGGMWSSPHGDGAWRYRRGSIGVEIYSEETVFSSWRLER